MTAPALMPRFTIQDAADIVYAGMRSGALKDAERRLMQSATVVDLVPWAEDSGPWSGPKQAPEERGRLFAEPGALGSTILWFTRDRRHHAATVYPPMTVGNVYQHLGRLWKIRRLEPIGPEAA